MKICAIICEFNPLHNGHRYLLRQAKEKSGCDLLLCIMSGSFTQRGEPTILDRYRRAGHAVLAGADGVILLPAAFACSSAEYFARGAVSILSSVPDVSCLAFGCETCNKEKLLSVAEALNERESEFREALSETMKQGIGYAKAMQEIGESMEIDGTFFRGANNGLALAYTREILKSGAPIEILPVQRQGADYRDDSLDSIYASATAIRSHLGCRELGQYVPPFVESELPSRSDYLVRFQTMCHWALRFVTREELSRVQGCSEGLDNALKNSENLDYDKLVAHLTGKRYTSSRIKRLLCANLLRLDRNILDRACQNDLFIKPLAVRKEVVDDMLSCLRKSDLVNLYRERDIVRLTDLGRQIWEEELFAENMFATVHQTAPTYPYTFLKI